MVRAHVRPPVPPDGRPGLSPARRAGLAAVAAIAALSAPLALRAAPAAEADPIEQLLRARASEIRMPEAAPRTPLAASGPANAGPANTGLASEGSAATAPPASVFDRVREGASSLVMEAMGFIGVRYRRGGNSAETGFDCSGFVRHVYNATFGIVLPRQAAEQAQSKDVVKVERADLQPGDLVFFNTLRRSFSHVGIYVGDNRFIHSPRTGEEVRTEKMDTPYWQRRYNGARRVVGNAFAAVAQAPARLLDTAPPDSRP